MSRDRNSNRMTSQSMPTPGKIIILNGPSSSGKTTLALALLEQLEMPFIRFSFDLFRDHKSFPLVRINKNEFSWAQMRPSIFQGLHRCIPAIASAGNNILFEHIIETKAWLHEIASLLSALDVFFVRVHCSLSELERREMQHGDRRPGEARQDFLTVSNLFAHDLEINSEHLLEENVTLLIKAWKERKHPSALDKIIEEITF